MKMQFALCGASSLLALALSTGAAGQTPTSVPAAEQATDTTDAREIIVTAQKREQSLNSVPLAITAVTKDELTTRGVTSVAELSKIEPSFVATTSTLGRPLYSIRGIGFNSDTLGAPPAVSVYVDQVAFPFAALSKGATLDVERVEILKGPQGTLFGQNATGGAVNYIAAKPTDELSFGVDASYARFNAVNLEGFLSGPISSTLKARLALRLERGGAWQYSTTRPGDELGDRNNKYARLLLDWEPVDTLRVSLNLNGWTNNSEPQAPQNFIYAPQFAAFSSFVPAAVNSPRVTDEARPADWYAQVPPKNNEDFYQASLRADYDISDNATITYLGTYEHYKQNDVNTYSGSATENYNMLHAIVKSTSHELRASGELADDRLRWMFGGSYARHKTDESALSSVGGITTAYVVAASVGLLNTVGPLRLGRNDMTQDIESKAVFGSLEYKLLDNLNVYGSARYTDTDNDHTGCPRIVDAAGSALLTATQNLLRSISGLPAGPTIPPGGCSSFDSVTFLSSSANDSLNEDNVSWRVGFDFTPVERTLLYANVSRGYKAGSFGNLGVALTEALAPAVQEKVTAYEAGFKSSLADRKIQVNGGVFYYDYRNKQQQLKTPDLRLGLLSRLLNVPKSSLKGAELAVTARPVQGLTLDAAVTYLDSKVIGDFFNYSQFATGRLDTTNFRGDSLPNTPKWTYNIGGQYEWALGAHHQAFIGGDVRHTSRTQSYFGSYSDAAKGRPSMINEAYTVLNLRAGVNSTDGKWRFQVFGDNILNEYYTTQAIRLDSVARFAGMPATYGVRVSYRY